MSKELAGELQEERQAEWIVIMDNELFTSIPREVREQFKRATIHYPEEHKYLMENDPMYQGMYNSKKRNNKGLEEIKYRYREQKRKDELSGNT